MLKDSPFSGWEMPSIRIYIREYERKKQGKSFIGRYRIIDSICTRAGIRFAAVDMLITL